MQCKHPIRPSPVPTPEATEREARGAIAAALWVDSLSFGVLFGTVGAFGLVAGYTTGFNPGWLVFALLGSTVFGGGYGFLVGQIVGLTLAVIATYVPRRSRTRVLRTAIPFVGLLVSVVPVILFVGHITAQVARFTAFDAALTLTGSALIYRRYRRLVARWERVIEAHRVH